MKGKILKCPVCGASEADNLHDMVYKCKYCSSVFSAPKDSGISTAEAREKPLFTCVCCKKDFFAYDWHKFSRNNLNKAKPVIGKKISVSYTLFHCPHCSGFVCLSCVEEGRFKRKYCKSCNNRVDEIGGHFIVEELKDVPGMFKKVFFRHKGKC